MYVYRFVLLSFQQVGYLGNLLQSKELTCRRNFGIKKIKQQGEKKTGDTGLLMEKKTFVDCSILSPLVYLNCTVQVFTFYTIFFFFQFCYSSTYCW